MSEGCKQPPQGASPAGVWNRTGLAKPASWEGWGKRTYALHRQSSLPLKQPFETAKPLSSPGVLPCKEQAPPLFSVGPSLSEKPKCWSERPCQQAILVSTHGCHQERLPDCTESVNGSLIFCVALFFSPLFRPMQIVGCGRGTGTSGEGCSLGAASAGSWCLQEPKRIPANSPKENKETLNMVIGWGCTSRFGSCTPAKPRG